MRRDPHTDYHTVTGVSKARFHQIHSLRIDYRVWFTPELLVFKTYVL